MVWQAEQPHNQLPTLPPNLDSIETKAVLKAFISASSAVAELKKALFFHCQPLKFSKSHRQVKGKQELLNGFFSITY